MLILHNFIWHMLGKPYKLPFILITTWWGRYEDPIVQMGMLRQREEAICPSHMQSVESAWLQSWGCLLSGHYSPLPKSIRKHPQEEACSHTLGKSCQAYFLQLEWMSAISKEWCSSPGAEGVCCAFREACLGLHGQAVSLLPDGPALTSEY